MDKQLMPIDQLSRRILVGPFFLFSFLGFLIQVWVDHKLKISKAGW
jgi:hypothetical protein